MIALTILHGSLNFTCFKFYLSDNSLTDNIDSYIIPKLNNHGYNKKEIEDNRKTGWVTFDNIFKSEFTKENLKIDENFIFKLRADDLSISPQEYSRAKQEILARTEGKITEQELEEELKKKIKRLQEAKLDIPNPQVYDVVINPKKELILFISSSKNIIIFEKLFDDTFPEIIIRKISPSFFDFQEDFSKKFQKIRESSFRITFDELTEIKGILRRERK